MSGNSLRSRYSISGNSLCNRYGIRGKSGNSLRRKSGKSLRRYRIRGKMRGTPWRSNRNAFVLKSFESSAIFGKKKIKYII
jgi:hypothetical protein